MPFLLDEFLEEFLNYFFTQILIIFIKYQSLALLCFLDELLEEFLNDHFLEEFLEEFLDDFWSRVSRSIFQTFWKQKGCAKFLVFYLAIKNVGYCHV